MGEFSSILEGLPEKAIKKARREMRERDENKLIQIQTKPRAVANKNVQLGCETCPANKKRAKKIFGDIQGRQIFVVAQNPGMTENKEGRALVGRSGQFLWRELQKVGIRRSDCDVSHAVRCLCYDDVGENGPISRTPNKVEIKHCSSHTQDELAKSKAKIFLVFGGLAAKQLFGTEVTKKTKMFWSDRLQARVYILDHPAFFMQGGGSQRLKEFRAALRGAGNDYLSIKTGKKKGFSRYAYLEEQDYAGIFRYKELKREARRLKHVAKKGIRITLDTEEDVIDGKLTLLCCGLCYKAGRARTIILDHPLAPKRSRKEIRKMKRLLANIIEDEDIKKAFQHGSHDVKQLKMLLEADTKGYDYDTEYAEWMSNPNRKAFGLDEIINARFPNFSGYKSIVMPEAAPGDLSREALGCDLPRGFENLPITKSYDFFRRKGLLRYSQIPLDKLILYNCGDCDVTKRIEVTTNKHVPYQLLQVYIDAGHVLDRMQNNGPIYDYSHSQKLQEFYPPRAEWLLKKLRKICGNEQLNPNSHPQIHKIIYHDLKLQKHLDEVSELNTRKSTMEILARVSKFAKYLLEYRRVAKIVSTYLKGFTSCANYNDGKIRTKFWLTGTSTGRLSSGGGKGKKDDDMRVVNLQNVVGDQYFQDTLVPDKNWRTLYNALVAKIKETSTGALGKIRQSIREIFVEKDKDRQKDLWKALDILRDQALESIAKRVDLNDAFYEKYGNIRVLLGYDFGQIEIRLAAQASGDENLIADCKAGDIHSLVGHTMTGWAVELILKDKKTRTLTKNVHFGILFGLAAKGLVAFLKAKDPDTEITIELAEQYIRNYFKRYKKVKRFIDRCRAFVEKHGYIENMFGFRRPLVVNDSFQRGDDGAEDSEGGGAYWGNQAINTPIQGAAHMLMLMAMSKLWRKAKLYVKNMGWPSLEIHDALYFFPRLKNLKKSFKLGKQLLEKEPLNVVKQRFKKIKWITPLAVEGKVGLRLGDTVEAEGMSLEKMLLSMTLETYVSEQSLKVEMEMAA